MSFANDKLIDLDDFDRALSTLQKPLAHFREHLRKGREALKQHHEQNGRPESIVSLHAWLMDQLIVRAWKHHLPLLQTKNTLALIAVGGYGRGELHPSSDIDLMLLTDNNRHGNLRAFIEPFIHFLWDMGLEVGHSVRSVKNCVLEAKKDITIVTNIMEARLLAGDKTLFDSMGKKCSPPKIWPSQKFLTAKMKEQTGRHHRFDDTAYNLEPNIKEGPGGLRDIQMIAWVTQRHFGSDSLHDLVRVKFLDEQEYRTLIKGRNFLWRIRNGLHYLAGRREDRLLFDHQRSLAKQFGYLDKSGSLAVEQLMKKYYRTVKELSLLNEILLQHLQEAITTRRSKVKPLNRRFQTNNGFLETKHSKVFERTPFALLEMFLLLQQYTDIKGVRARTIRQVRANLHRIDQKFRKDVVCRSLFMEILKQPTGITHALRRMNAYGVLGAYLPAFGRIVGQMQHDLFHVYTVDEHILFVLRNVRRFTIPEFRHEFPFASTLVQNLVKPERLYLAALFHDIAKGRGGDHSSFGEKDAQAFCRLHGLSDYDTRFIAWLVRHHLLMSVTAQKQDIFDPEVVLEFARKMVNQEHLDNLYLLTVADMCGTSPRVWNVWKDNLLTQLYRATTRALARGIGTTFEIDEHIARLRKDTQEILKNRDVSIELVKKYWDQLDNDYFLRHDAEAVAWHAESIIGASAGDPTLVSTRYHPAAGGTECLIYIPDREGLFSTLTSGFDRLHLSIMDARIYTTRNGFALDTFVVLDHMGKAVSDAKSLQHMRKAMHDQLANPRPGKDARSAQLPRQLKHFPIATKVNFSLAPNQQQTLMEVITQDRPGLLYQVALALQQCHVNLDAAKVSTYGERAEDIFFVTNHDNRPISKEEQACLHEQVLQRLTDQTPLKPGMESRIAF